MVFEHVLFGEAENRWLYLIFFKLKVTVFVSFFFFFGHVSSSLADKTFRYRTTISGNLSNVIKDEIIESLDTHKLENSHIIGSKSTLMKVMEQDRKIINKILRSHGYYSSKIDLEIRELEGEYEAYFSVDTGPQFKFSVIEITTKSHDKTLQARLYRIAEQHGMVKGAPCVNKRIFGVEDEIIIGLKNLGYPFAKFVDKQYIVDYTKNGMDVKYEIETGPQAFFGDLIISGLDNTRYDYIMKMLGWKQGELFSETRLEQVQKLLYQSGLFSTVNIRTAETLGKDSKLDVYVEVKERKHKSITGGISYRTYEGPGVSAGWHNLNLFGGAERLSFKGRVLNNSYSQDLSFVKPYFLDKPQEMSLSLQNKKEEQDAYDSRKVTFEGMITIPSWKKITLGYGILAKDAKVIQGSKEETYSLVAAPLRIGRTKVDDLLNPSSGYKIFTTLYPSYLIGDSREFLKVFSGGSFYLPVSADKKSVLAGRLNLGLIGNVSSEAIPADERFYAGGDQSVRGYAYQSLGEMKDGQAIGGKGILEFGVEIRKRVKEDLGLVLFLDGGSVYRSYPIDGSSRMMYGSGFGVRYLTPVGPIRFDIATPLNRRPGIDKYFAVYFSVGQAF